VERELESLGKRKELKVQRILLTLTKFILAEFQIMTGTAKHSTSYATAQPKRLKKRKRIILNHFLELEAQ